VTDRFARLETTFKAIYCAPSLHASPLHHLCDVLFHKVFQNCGVRGRVDVEGLCRVAARCERLMAEVVSIGGVDLAGHSSTTVSVVETEPADIWFRPPVTSLHKPRAYQMASRRRIAGQGVANRGSTGLIAETVSETSPPISEELQEDFRSWRLSVSFLP
jgi:hypothetical protein